jgi:proline iminopeptidase
MRIETEGAGETVVIAGGGPGVGHAHYHPWFSALADRFLVAYLEYEGTTIEGYGEQIEAVRQQLGAERVAVLSNAQVSAATWQRGNIDAVNAALRAHYPERWARLLELRERGVRSLDDEIQEMYGELLERMEWADPARRPALRQGAPPDMAVYAAVAGDDPEWEVGGTMAAFDPDLSRVAAPTLVVSGRWDGLTTPQLAHETAAALPRAELAVLERSGHRPWCEEPERYFALVGDFLSAARPAR